MQKKATLPINLNINIDENLTDNPILEELSQFRVNQLINQKRLDLQSNLISFRSYKI
jgi:hypothetical protein